MVQSLTSRGKLVKLESPEFEKLFKVHCDDQIQARYILTPSLMERIIEYRKKFGSRIWMSFIDTKLYVMVDHDRDLFEPDMYRNLVDFELIQGYYQDLALVTDIVNDLNLNTRIWTKE